MESPKKMQSISPKSDDELMIKPKSPDNDSSLIVGRSGRVRKAKVVFDPSDVENKRRSMPIMEVTKATKRQATAVKLIENIKVEKKSNQDEDVAEQVFSSLATINKRRKTISVAAFENGCVVCLRADIKKGRFVNCIGCTKRGHFTCLRNDKLFKTTDTEKRWQCPSCKVCKACEKAKPNVSRIICVVEILKIIFKF